MAPRTRNNDKNKHRHSRRKEVRFPRREIPVRKSATAIRPPANYENLILYYLTKLKRLFTVPNHPQPGTRENSADKMRREQSVDKSKPKSSLEIDGNKYTASHSAPKPHEEDEGPGGTDHDIKDKVYNVVNAAIEYGFANNVLEKKGDCFVFKSKRNSKIANRQLTPGPSGVKPSYCSQCNCSKCKNFIIPSNKNYRHCQNVRPLSENNSHRPERRPDSVNESKLHESKTQHPLGLGGRANRASIHDNRKSSRSRSCTITPHNQKYRVKKICTCSKCRALEQRRKMQKK